MCSAQVPAVQMWRLRRASYLAVSVSRHVTYSIYLPGGIGMKSRMGRLKSHISGDSFVSGSGVLRYWSIALCTASVSSSPSGLYCQ